MGVDVVSGRIELADHGIELAAPFLDNTAIRVRLAVPADERGSPSSYKLLLDAAFADSGFVLARTTKGEFNVLAYAGLRVGAPGLNDLLGPASQLATLGLVAGQPVADGWARARPGPVAAAVPAHRPGRPSRSRRRDSRAVQLGS